MTLGRSVISWLALFAGALASGSAAADTLYGTGGVPLVEKSHTATLRMMRGHAELVVRRTLRNESDRPAQAQLYFDVPEGAVATGLRALGTKANMPFWFGAELLDAKLAAANYSALPGANEHDAKPSVLLAWRAEASLEMDLFPLPPHEPTSVEYTLMLPTIYREGRDHLHLPHDGPGAPYGDVVVVPEFPLDGLVVNDVATSGALHLNAAQDADVALTRHDPPLLGGALAMVPFAKNRFLVHQHIEVAARLSQVPVGAGVVVIIDASRSITEDSLEAEIIAAKAYLSHFADAKVEVLTFDREVHPRHNHFVPVKEALADLGAVPTERHNGSRVDAAITRAGELLATLPSAAPRRVVIFTDALTRASLAENRIGDAIAQTRAIVHVVQIMRGSPELERDDEHDWARAVRATGGLAWRGLAEKESEKSEAENRRAFEELARPLRIDHVRYDIQNLSADDVGFPTTFAEGEGIEDLRVTFERVRWARVDGELWSTPVRTVLLPDEAENKLWSALALRSSVSGELDEKDQMVLAKRGGAVSPVTSYLLATPGDRPKTDGVEMSISVSCGSGGGHSTDCAIHSGTAIAHDLEGRLRRMLAPRFAACGGADDHAEIRLETTLREVVDVTDVRVAGEYDSVARCLEAAVWELDLPVQFRQAHRSFTIRL